MKIIQYGYYDGIPTLRDSEVMDLYRRMLRDKTADTVFYDGSIRNPKDFLLFIKSCCTMIVAMSDEGEPLGMGWLNNRHMRSVDGHFCLFCDAWGSNSVEIGKSMVEYAVNLKQDGEQIFDVIIGTIPKWNKAAIMFAEKCGAVIVGDIPCAVYDFESGVSKSATIVYYQRRQ
jgi:hypothetical protein